MEEKDFITYEYGAMSSLYSCKAKSKLVAYATMVLHFQQSAHMIAIYAPEESKRDSWLNISGQISGKLHEIFGGKPEDFPVNDAFDRYINEHIKEIQECYRTIEQLC